MTLRGLSVSYYHLPTLTLPLSLFLSSACFVAASVRGLFHRTHIDPKPVEIKLSPRIPPLIPWGPRKF